MTLILTYADYLNRILGGWIGKSIGGAVGARFEGYKGWIEISPREMFPATIPPNDDLDLQVLWLHVLEEKGAALTSDDLAQAWIEQCWYPFNEYGTFRRNWRLGIHPPDSGRYDNAFWETGMGCPIRSEIWGYVFPGAPDLAARYAALDGALDHTEQSVGAEQMLAGMAAMAFFIHDVRRLIAMNQHYLPQGATITRLTQAALDAYDRGLTLREARELLLSLEGHPEACDARLNVPFTLLALLYGHNDLQETLLAALRCGYDTDCTLATSGALIGQILGAQGIPEYLRAPIGDELVMGIEYRRPEMTLSALARDTARVGAMFCGAVNTAAEIRDCPPLKRLPASPAQQPISLRVEYEGLPCAAPGETVCVRVMVRGELPTQPVKLTVEPPAGWQALPRECPISDTMREARLTLYALPDSPTLPMRNLFTLRLGNEATHVFGVAGAALWRFLGVYFDPTPPAGDETAQRRAFQHHFVRPAYHYLPEPDMDVRALYERWSRILGKPALAAARERSVELAQVTRLEGACVAYLARTIISPAEREVYLVVGNNDGYRLYLNGELVGEADEQVWWTPFNNTHAVRLRAGENHLLVALVKRGDQLHWSLGVREAVRQGQNMNDWCTDLSDVNPLAG